MQSRMAVLGSSAGYMAKNNHSAWNVISFHRDGPDPQTSAELVPMVSPPSHWGQQLMVVVGKHFTC